MALFARKPDGPGATCAKLVLDFAGKPD